MSNQTKIDRCHHVRPVRRMIKLFKAAGVNNNTTRRLLRRIVIEENSGGQISTPLLFDGIAQLVRDIGIILAHDCGFRWEIVN